MDTFAGFPTDLKAVAAHLNRAEYGECYEDVVREFSPFKNVVLVRGQIPETLSQVTSTKVAYLSIDMNVAEPEVAALEYFWDKIVTGAMVVLDDYGFGEPYHRQKTAMNELAARLGGDVLLLPTGQGLILKP